MSKAQKLFEKILFGKSDANIDFNELKNLLLKLGFSVRIKVLYAHMSDKSIYVSTNYSFDFFKKS